MQTFPKVKPGGPGSFQVILVDLGEGHSLCRSSRFGSSHSSDVRGRVVALGS